VGRSGGWGVDFSLRIMKNIGGTRRIRTADLLITKNSPALENLTQQKNCRKNSADNSARDRLLWLSRVDVETKSKQLGRSSSGGPAHQCNIPRPAPPS